MKYHYLPFCSSPRCLLASLRGDFDKCLIKNFVNAHYALLVMHNAH